MIFFAMLAVFAALFATLTAKSVVALAAAKEYQAQASAYVANDVAQSVQLYTTLYGKPPQLTNTALYSTALQELANTAGFEPLKAYIATSKGGSNGKNRDIAAIITTPDYSSSTSLINSSYAMQQSFVVTDYNYSNDLSQYTSAANNTTSTVRTCTSDGKDAATSASYCPKKVGTAYTRIANESYNMMDAAQRRLKAISDKFEAVYKNSGTVPGTTNSTVALNTAVNNTSGGINATSSTACEGVFNYNLVPLSCADLYLGSNQPVSYTKLAANQIRLTVSNYYYDKNRTLQSYSYVRTF